MDRKLKINHTMKLINPYYQYVRDGEKKYEIRINDEKRQLFQIGNVIQITFNDKIGNIYVDKPNYFVRVTEKNLYKNFREAIIDSGIRNVLPNVSDTEEGISIYENFMHRDGLFKHVALKYGIVRFKFQVIDTNSNNNTNTNTYTNSNTNTNTNNHNHSDDYDSILNIQ